MDGLPSQQRQRDNADNRFHYPQSTRLPRLKNGPRQVDQSFPPHPSVRVPPNVKTAGRQVLAGVGVAPRPGGPQSQPRPQLHPPPARPLNAANTVQNFKFPQVPPPIPESRRVRDLAPPQRGRYNMHDSYVSSMDEDSTPKTTPSSKSGRFPTPPGPPRESSVYPESEYSPQPAYPSSRIMPPSEFPTPGQSRGTNSYDEALRRPPQIATTDLGTPSRPKLGEISPASSRTTAMNALTAAIAAGFAHQQPSPGASTPPARTFSPMRMPFETDRSRPRSPEAQEELEPPQLRDATVSNNTEQTPGSAISNGSTNPLLGLGINQPGMSSKVPVTKRPPKLDIDAVRDMEARGSTTSLAELIRRATKLASNLDRGKTASRLGMLDMFGSSEKLGVHAPGNRDSSMSDLMSAFPAPAAGATPRRDTMWPLGEKGYLVDEQEVRSKSAKKKRKCCGLSLPVFIAILIIVVVLVAAAVLLPIFLILVPKQHHGHFDFSTCPTAYACQNGGTSLVSNNACQCVCSNGFIGAHCEMLGTGGDCTTASLSDGSQEYSNATVGSSIMPIFSGATSQFDIALNASSILSLFSLNNLSCTSENQLVDFNGTTATSTDTNNKAKAKRFIMLASPTPTAILPRQVESSAGIVFAASSTDAPSPTSTDASAVSTVTSLSNTDSASATPTTSANFAPLDIPESQVSFARVVVLYVLQRSNAVSVAVNAQQKMQSFFVSASGESSGSSAGNQKIAVGFGELQITADFGKLEILEGGKTV